jgi:Holliday junction resolvasome RuvABC endonuclease subunit
MIVIGVDPGFAALGLAALDTDVGPVELHVIRTQKTRRKNAMMADDNVRRIRHLADQMEMFSATYSGIVCAEAQSWPRSASACAKVGMCWGVIVALSHDVLQLSPQAIKKHLCGSRSASKDAVRTALEGRYAIPPEMWPQPKSVQEHAADALAAAVTCWEIHPVLRAARKIRGRS